MCDFQGFRLFNFSVFGLFWQWKHRLNRTFLGGKTGLETGAGWRVLKLDGKVAQCVALSSPNKMVPGLSFDRVSRPFFTGFACSLHGNPLCALVSLTIQKNIQQRWIRDTKLSVDNECVCVSHAIHPGCPPPNIPMTLQMIYKAVMENGWMLSPCCSGFLPQDLRDRWIVDTRNCVFMSFCVSPAKD